MSDGQRLQTLIRRGHPALSINTFEEDFALELVRTAALELSRPLWVWSVAGGAQDGLLADGAQRGGTEDPSAAFAYFATLERRPLCALLDVAAHLREPRSLRAFRNLLNHARRSGAQLILIDHDAELPDVIAVHAAPLALSLPDEPELEALIRATLREANRERHIEIKLSRHELQVIVRNLRGLTRRQAAQIIRETVLDDQRFSAEDSNHVLAEKRRALSHAGLLEYMETPVALDKIGGLKRLKRWLKKRELAHSPKAREFGLAAPRGVLLLGVQGAGKSLCAKAVATAWSQPLLRMDVGALYDRYVGESERRLRDTLRQADRMAPVVLWIDEIEKAFASAASRSSDGGLSQRMFGTLLTWLQERQTAVFVVATANDIDALPPELLRKGRFDEIFFVDLPVHETRREIFAIHLRGCARDPAKFDLDALAVAGEGYSGAEIEQSIGAALYDSFAGGKELETAAILRSLKASPPLSVTMSERIQALRTWAASRCVPAE